MPLLCELKQHSRAGKTDCDACEVSFWSANRGFRHVMIHETPAASHQISGIRSGTGALAKHSVLVSRTPVGWAAAGMKRALRGALRGPPTSMRGRRPPFPPLVPRSSVGNMMSSSSRVVGSRRIIVSVGNQLLSSSSLSQRCSSSLQQQQQQQGWATVAFGEGGCAARSSVFQIAPTTRHPLSGFGSAGSRGRGRRGDSGTRFSPRFSSATEATAAAAAALAVATGGGGERANCEYPEGTKFGDVYFCSGEALGSGERERESDGGSLGSFECSFSYTKYIVSYHTIRAIIFCVW